MAIINRWCFLSQLSFLGILPVVKYVMLISHPGDPTSEKTLDEQLDAKVDL
jgi:hypothetical protein